MKNTKVIAMYLPQYHQIPENDKWWGEGFTDWVSARTASPLYEGHAQPKVPLNQNYYDLSNVDTIRWQVRLAKKYGIYGFGIYHYWFSSHLQLLTKPAELLLEAKEIDIPFLFAWDNCSWVRTWSKLKHNANAWSPKFDQNRDSSESGILAELVYGDRADWERHFEYLAKFFQDPRYIKINQKPVFIFFNYNQKEVMAEMIACWNQLAKKMGFAGIYAMSRKNPYDSMEGLDSLFTYEPMFTAWQNKNIFTRVGDKLQSKLPTEKLIRFDYDKVWKGILSHAQKNTEKDIMFGAFVNYDDTPRRGARGKIICGGTPEKFKNYFQQLMRISAQKEKEFLFLTAWNEWGEGAFLEPEEGNGYAYLEALKGAIENTTG